MTQRKIFTVEIAIGNDAMGTGADIAEALEKVAREVREQETPEPLHSRRIHDANGNTVGSWNVAYEERQ